MDAKLLLDSLDYGVVAIASDWTIAAWSATAARITGLPAERVLGQSFWVAFPAARATHIERVLQEVLHDGKPQMYLAPATATGRVPTGMGDPVAFEKAALPLLSITETLFDM